MGYSSLFAWFHTFLGFLGVLALFLIVAALFFLVVVRGKQTSKDFKIQIKCLNKSLEKQKKLILENILEDKKLKELKKQQKKQDKKNLKNEKKIFVLDFQGDVSASILPQFTELVSSLLQVVTPQDEVVVRLESPGGHVHAYGLAAAQLARLRNSGTPLTVCVDKVAASGGYLMACLAHTICCAPFAIVGSIGVVANVPNFHRFLTKNNVDYFEVTAGEYKRTLSMFGEPTEKGISKFKTQLEEVHLQFKNHVSCFRPQLNLETVGTGDYWLGTKAFEMGLVDLITTSDDYLLKKMNDFDIYLLSIPQKESLRQKFMSLSENILQKTFHSHNLFF